MNKIDTILCLALIANLIVSMRTYKQYKELKNKSKIKLHRCIFNENTDCYEEACGYCDKKITCNQYCVVNCDNCSGHKIEYLNRMHEEVKGGQFHD
jgi:hypothetical protein